MQRKRPTPSNAVAGEFGWSLSPASSPPSAPLRMADTKRSVLLPQPFADLSSNNLFNRGRRTKAASLMSPDTLKVTAAVDAMASAGPTTPAVASVHSPRLTSPPPSSNKKFTPRRRARLTTSARLPSTDVSSPKRSPLTSGWKGSTGLPRSPLSVLPCRLEDSPRRRARSDEPSRRNGRRAVAGLSLLVLLVLGSASVAGLLAALLAQGRPAVELPMVQLGTSWATSRRTRQGRVAVRAEPQPVLQLPAPPPAPSCRWQWKALRCSPSDACRLAWAWPPCKSRSSSAGRS